MALLNISFTEHEIASFLNRINVTRSKVSVHFLKSIVSGILEYIPFQNFSMLTNEWIRPSEAMIKKDMLSGLGGLCTVRNPFLHQFLKALGFEVRFASATMLEPDCHISLIVTIEGNDWWVDVGNGYPYMDPIQLGDENMKSNWFMDYKLVLVDGRFYVHHKSQNKDWEMNHHFSPEGVAYSVFDQMHHLHYSVPGWGPFLTGLRVNRFWKYGGIIIRDERTYSPDGEGAVTSVNELTTFLKKWFPNPGFVESIDVIKADRLWRKTHMEVYG